MENGREERAGAESACDGGEAELLDDGLEERRAVEHGDELVAGIDAEVAEPGASGGERVREQIAGGDRDDAQDAVEGQGAGRAAILEEREDGGPRAGILDIEDGIGADDGDDLAAELERAEQLGRGEGDRLQFGQGEHLAHSEDGQREALSCALRDQVNHRARGGGVHGGTAAVQPRCLRMISTRAFVSKGFVT